MPDELNEIVERAVAGDKGAFGELYNIYLDRIYRFIYYLVNDEFLAEDLTQNTFLKSWQKIREFSTKKGTFQSYLYTIARNLVIDYQRKRKEISLELTLGDDIKSNTDLEANLAREESMNNVRKALFFLEPDDRQIIIFRYFEEMSFDEIAEILDMKSANVRVKVHRLLKTLKGNLENQR